MVVKHFLSVLSESHIWLLCYWLWSSELGFKIIESSIYVLRFGPKWQFSSLQRTLLSVVSILIYLQSILFYFFLSMSLFTPFRKSFFILSFSIETYILDSVFLLQCLSISLYIPLFIHQSFYNPCFLIILQMPHAQEKQPSPTGQDLSWT